MGLVSFLYNLTNGTTADADQVMANLNTLKDAINGNLDSANLANDSVGASELGAGVVGVSELAAPAAWTNFTMQNGFGNYDNFSYYKDLLGRVHVRGSVQVPAGGTSQGAVMATLPPGFRPDVYSAWIVSSNEAGQVREIEILGNGDVRIGNNGITQPAASAVLRASAIDFRAA